MSIQALGKLLAADRPKRQLRYRLLTFGETGYTNKGKITASAGALTLPADDQALPVNIEHEATRPVGTMSVEEHAEGLDAVVDVANTTAGNDVLEEAALGLRAGISVEIDNPLIRGGKLLAGMLSGSGLVVKPAFPSSMLTAAAADLDETEDGEEEDPEETEDDPSEDTTDTEGNPVPKKKLEASGTPSLLQQLAAALKEEAPKAELQLKASEGVSLDQLTATIFGSAGITNPQLKAAAFDTITQADMYDPTSVPQYLDELAQARTYRSIYSPLFAPATLTGMEIEGWHIEKKPTVGTWDPAFSGVAPNETMNDIPTSEVTFKKETWTAKRIAGGNRFDRIHVDFPNPRAMSAFVREQDQAVVERLDLLSKAKFLSLAVTKEATGSDKADVWAKLIFGVAHALKFGLPDYAVIGNDIWRQMKNTAKIDAREFLAAELGLEEGSLNGFGIVPAEVDDAAMNGRLFVGSKAACQLYTPPGSVVRVDAQELQKGALDKAVFGYYGFVPHYEAAAKNGIVEVTAGV